jgi:asparagine synthase (glutamine-hydrolysing)
MFALAWHNKSGTFLARDRYGKIPLYLAKNADSIFFASEIKALPKKLKAKALRPGYVLNLLSMEEIKWTKEKIPEFCTPENVLSFLRHGVKQRLLSDRPVCFLLSGGLDSSLVLALARELHPEPVAYTAVLDPQSADLIAARKIAKELDVPLQEVKVCPPTLDEIHAAIKTVENPMKAQIEIALIHMPLMKAIASDGFRVTLSGEAADELFCGYGSMQIAASKSKTDFEYQQILKNTVKKMSRGNFIRVNKVMMSAGVEGRLPFMEERLVTSALHAPKNMNPPNKKVLKVAAKEILPKWLINRPKQTFQGGSGMSKAVQSLGINPVRYYNSLAVHEFGWRPTE